VHVPRDRYVEILRALRDEGFDMCVDLTVVDHLTNDRRRLPTAVEKERYEVVVNLVSMHDRRRLRVRAAVPADDPVIPSLFELWPGTEALEREAWDLFGIRFEGHPDLTRILMPDDWEGHPLRKDYAVGRIPVQFRGAPQPR
jgi:NADH-quinone oxidoreductase subunit C